MASTYYDMFKDSNNFFQALKTSAQNNMQAAPWQVLNEWADNVRQHEHRWKFQKGGKNRPNNNKYQAFVAVVSQNGGYEPRMIGD